MNKYISLITICLLSLNSNGQKVDSKVIAKNIEAYKNDVRGPYKDIRWFCKDGSTVAPKERCPEIGGVQRARYKDEVIQLAKSNHVFLGQILSTTDIEQFWDKEYHMSQLKQYQIEQFLRSNDNGWINRKAQFYRGAFQVEDEEAWGIKFFTWVLNDTKKIEKNYFLIRQSAKDIPHAAENNTSQKVRAISKEISDKYAPFMDLRVKIHGQPDQSDIQKVETFRKNHKSKSSIEIDGKFEQLIESMKILYKPIDVSDFKQYSDKVPSNSISYKAIQEFIVGYKSAKDSKSKSNLILIASEVIRKEILKPLKPESRLALLDASNKLELLLFQEAALWKPSTLKDQMIKVRALTRALAAYGYLEIWESQEVIDKMILPTSEEITHYDLSEFLDQARKAVEWGTSMVRVTYEEDVHLFEGFEPMAAGFMDDKVRSTILLPYGNSASILGDFFSEKAGLSNSVMGLKNQSSFRGLNAGYAYGELVVTTKSPDELEVSSDKIYVFNRPPSDLKPVAGIATVTEGNMVSHVQLLARNLGIPNAVLSIENLNSLMKFNGKKVFYAVSNKGTVVMKPEEQMTNVEKALFSKKARSEEMISVPVNKMELKSMNVLNLRDVDASKSGKVCGPKAANLGQLKQLFPDNVVEGLVIPFSIFRQHFNQEMPGQNKSYWEFLNTIFKESERQRKNGSSDTQVEVYILSRLEILRNAIKVMPLLPEFEKDLKQNFKSILGKELGQIPVFIRSDTNMEDLKDFTGAGLNLTLFNVLETSKILQGIKDVWASPYAERSYKWRQRYLLNPENVFPSILIIPGVNADYSGVMITKGVSTGNTNDITLAFNRGVGGAVEGQASETWLISPDKISLISPAREVEYMSLPVTGGTTKRKTTFEQRLLSESDLSTIQAMAKALNKKLPGVDVKGPYDVELGLKDGKIWLFQVRPFVENKRAAASEYLRSITPELNQNKTILLNSSLQ